MLIRNIPKRSFHKLTKLSGIQQEIVSNDFTLAKPEISKLTHNNDSGFHKSILSIKRLIQDDEAERLFSFIKNHDVVLPESSISKILNYSLIKEKHFELYKILLEKNYPIHQMKYAPLRSQLMKSEDTEILEFYELQNSEIRSKYLKLYSFEMIKKITIKYIKRNDHDMASRYLQLLIEKIPGLSASESTPLPLFKNKNFARKQMIADLYEIITFFSVKLVNYESALHILVFLNQNNLKITPKLVHIILTSLRSKKQYDSNISLLKQLPQLFPDQPSVKLKSFSDIKEYQRFKKMVVIEFMEILMLKFNDIKVLLAYIMVIYPNAKQSLDKDLGILGMIYNRTPGALRKQDDLIKAEINEWFVMEDATLPLELLTVIYREVFHVIKHDKKLQDPKIVRTFFEKFINYSKRSKDLCKYMDDYILNLFVSFSLKAFKQKNSLEFLKMYLEAFPNLKKFESKTINKIFLHHGSFKGSKHDEIVDLFSEYGLEVDFNLCLAIIKKSIRANDIPKAETWYYKMKDEYKYSMDHPKLKSYAATYRWDYHTLDLGSNNIDEFDLSNEMIEEDVQDVQDDREFTEEFRKILDSITDKSKKGKTKRSEKGPKPIE
ncbi:hypothetical protein WICMUC_004665 [Wickerhamomyces mucosus]|uniref:Uncharacterized protein n=1 Tax=Wickerhamomyces mucosus TaxID=1378264 RepID=A0A9P8PFK0_9ASCO|nr:hypothetical protein WICMUC_004665 [Wickerhamomyces mucosus]